MESLFEKVQNGRLWPLTGGIHLPAHKAITANQPIATMALPKTLIVPLKQHIGVAGKLLVAAGDRVLKGQPLSAAGQGLSLPIHAPSSGQIEKIADHPIAHPSGLSEPCIFIQTDGHERWVERRKITHLSDKTPAELIEKIKQAGISGMGGAGFPAYVKSATAKKINYLLINATECEPYISADDTLLQRSAEDIIRGLDILIAIVNPEMIMIGIEEDKPKAIAALKSAARHRDDIHVRVFPAKYPSGGEKQLIHMLTGQQVPSAGLPLDIGIIVHNIGTLYAIYKAVILDEPVISRVVTVTGGALNKPQNIEVLLGTPVRELLQYCEFVPLAKQRIIMGGPMMGFTLATTEVPIVKISNCILAPGKNELPPADNEMDCIRCGACADACPVSLLPQQLFWYSKTKDYDKARQYNLADCIECGACAWVCPSEIPLVHYYRVAKAQIKAEAEEKQLAEKAKVRFEARIERLQRDAEVREEKARLATEKRKAALQKSGKTATVADALARVKARKAQQAATTGSGDNSDSNADAGNKNPAVAAALARAKAKKQARAQQADAAGNDKTGKEDNAITNAGDASSGITPVSGPEHDMPGDDSQIISPDSAPDAAQTVTQSTGQQKKAAIKAAIARAKAKKKAKDDL